LKIVYIYIAIVYCLGLPDSDDRDVVCYDEDTIQYLYKTAEFT